MFFFVWSNDGGPLQYIGLALFLLQLSPVLSPSIDISLFIRTFSFVLFGLVALILAYLMHRDGIGATLATLGGARNMVVSNMTRTYQQMARTTRELWGGNNNNNGGDNAERQRLIPMLLLMVGILSLLSLSLLPLGPGVIIALAHGLAVSIFFLGLNRGLGGDPTEGGNRPPSSSNRSGNTLSDIIKIIGAMPVEEYIPEDQIDKCSISKLLRMLDVRNGCNDDKQGSTSSKATDHHDYVERKELVDAVRQRRKASDSCCICFEEYKASDPLRVLPRCCHEFHLECIDQWAYTYASSRNRRMQEPSCPLCKTALK